MPARRVLAVAASLLILAFTASAAAAAPRDPLTNARFRGLTSAERTWIGSVVDATPVRARTAIAQVAPRLTLRRGAADEAAGGDHAVTVLGGADDGRITLSYGPVTLAGGAFGAHLLLHELGHAIDTALVTDPLRDEFTAAWITAPGWQACYPQPTGSSSRCVPWAEIFADQFAFYATGDRDVRSSYAVPPLLGRSRFGTLLRRVTTAADAV